MLPDNSTNIQQSPLYPSQYHNILSTTLLPAYRIQPHYYHNVSKLNTTTILSQHYHNTTTATATAKTTVTATTAHLNKLPQYTHNTITMMIQYYIANINKHNTMNYNQSYQSIKIIYLLPQWCPNTTAILPRPRPRPATATAMVHCALSCMNTYMNEFYYLLLLTYITTTTNYYFRLITKL
jgi:hypothetical protein